MDGYINNDSEQSNRTIGFARDDPYQVISSASISDKAKDISLPLKYTGNIRDNASLKRKKKNAISRISITLNAAVLRFYRFWAGFVVDHPLKIIAFCVILTITCTARMVTKKRENNVRGYTPYGSRSLYEFDVRDEFFDQDGTGIRFIVLIMPKNTKEVNGSMTKSMLDLDALEEAVNIDDIVQNDLPIYNRKTKRNESFSEFCKLFCAANEPVRAFYGGLKFQLDQIQKGGEPDGRIVLDYPVSNIFGRSINLLPNFFGVTRKTNANRSLIATDNSQEPFEIDFSTALTTINGVEMIVLLYRAERVGGWTDSDIFDYEMGISRHFEYNYMPKHVRVMSISTSYVSEEVDRAGRTLMPFVGVGFVMMLVCAVITCSVSAIYMHQFSIYKLALSVFACLCPFMASGTALGLVFFLGLRNSSVLSLSPFLILAIGVDDSFLTMHSWQIVCKRVTTKTPDGNGHICNVSIEERLIMVLKDTGPAILISALTNLLADAVGSFTSSPEITILCVGNITAIIIDFFYQVTLFTALLVVFVQMEEKAMQKAAEHDRPGILVDNIQHWSSVNWIKSIESVASATITQKKATTSCKEDFGIRDVMRSQLSNFVDNYVNLITNTVVATVISFIWLLFLFVCVFAITKFEINLTTHKLFVHDSPLIEIETQRENIVLPSYTTAQIFVNRPGNLSDPMRRARLDQMVAEMESLPYAFGTPDATYYFLRDFDIFEEIINNNEGSEELQGMPKDLTTAKVVITEKAEAASISEPTKNDSHTLLSGNGTSLMLLSATVATTTNGVQIHTSFSKRDDSSVTVNFTALRRKRAIFAGDGNMTSVPAPHNVGNVEDNLNTFLQWPDYEHWASFVKYHPADNNTVLEGAVKHLIFDKIMITVGYHGDDLRDWYKRAKMLGDWRRVIDHYVDDFNVSVLHDEGLYLDLLENMSTDIWQSLIGTLVCMSIICLVFMNHIFVMLIATTVIASIMIATLGIISMQHMTIDPVVMAAVVISLGFSVDIPTHISYHFRMAAQEHMQHIEQRRRSIRYYSVRVERPCDGSPTDWTLPNNADRPSMIVAKDAVRFAFKSVGFPAIQASICMNICVLCLLLVPVYIAQVFVRVMCLCATLCAIHSFVLLPALFALFDVLAGHFPKREKKQHNENTNSCQKNTLPTMTNRH